jgi:hypothetical protein
MTSQYEARRSYGWYQQLSRFAWWAVPAVPGVAWYMFGWLTDDLKALVTLGLYKPVLYHPDVNLSSYRSQWVIDILKPYD